MGKKIKPPPHTELNERQSFERFERLAKGLMAVPKKELDKELAKHEQKTHRTKPRKRSPG
jgi:hypothetical protein